MNHGDFHFYYVYNQPLPPDAIVIEFDFCGSESSVGDFDKLFGVNNYNMKKTSQTTTYEMTKTDLIQLLAKELNVVESKISIVFKTREIITDPHTESYGNPIYETYGLDVIVKE